MPDRGIALSLRTRMVLLGTIGVTLILLAGGLLLGGVWRRTLIGNVSQTTALRSRDIAALVKRGTVPDPIPVSGRDEALVQIVGPDGDVVAASANLRQRPALVLPRPPAGETAVSQVEFLPVDDDEAGFRVAASTVQTAAGPTTVFVASSLEDVTDTIAVAARLVLTALLLLLLPLCAALWVLVSRTLAPVAAITAEAREISARDLHRRVPQPRRRDEIGLLADTLNRMLSRLEAASTRQRRFVADAAHELRSPIANLRTQLETARASSQRVDWLSTSGDLLATTIRMQRLSDQLLLLARLDGAGLAPRRRAVDLDDVVAVAVARMHDGHELEIDLSALLPVQLQADPTLVEHAVGNLIDNALRHARSRLRVVTTSDDHIALVTVEDDGPGIPADRRDHVVRPFARLDEARDRDGGGAGLGLTIAGDIAAAHGGRLTIGDSDLGGAAVRIELRWEPRGT
ncbi:MAG: ATP-binding protein [Actinomycetota bacterium]|nr:HAMP domain-containing protein [Euzebyaceae bacterium]MDQ3451711.1 ATP-binding protein [Actinomycetota bacterium]